MIHELLKNGLTLEILEQLTQAWLPVCWHLLPGLAF